MTKNLLQRLESELRGEERKHDWAGGTWEGAVRVYPKVCRREDCGYVWRADVPSEPMGCRGTDNDPVMPGGQEA